MENLYTTKILRVGTSLAIIIPKSILTALNFQRGDSVLLSCEYAGVLRVRALTDGEIKHLRESLPVISVS